MEWIRGNGTCGIGLGILEGIVDCDYCFSYFYACCFGGWHCADCCDLRRISVILLYRAFAFVDDATRSAPSMRRETYEFMKTLFELVVPHLA